MKKHWKRWLSLSLLMLLVLMTWLFWPDRKLAQAKALQKELFSPEARSLPPEQRREKWQEFRKLTEKMTPEQREVLSAESRKRQLQEMGRYFSMSPAEKTKHLDDRIRGMEKMRQQMQSKSGKGGPPGGARPGTGAATGAGNSGANAVGQTGPRDRSPAGRDQGRQKRLDSTTPAERAMFTQYMKDLNARRTQLGLPPMGRGSRPPR
jgi:hypothetical protein